MYLFGHMAKLRRALRIDLIIVTKHNWLKCKEHFASASDRLNVLLETCRGRIVGSTFAAISCLGIPIGAIFGGLLFMLLRVQKSALSSRRLSNQAM